MAREHTIKEHKLRPLVFPRKEKKKISPLFNYIKTQNSAPADLGKKNYYFIYLVYFMFFCLNVYYLKKWIEPSWFLINAWWMCLLTSKMWSGCCWTWGVSPRHPFSPPTDFLQGNTFYHWTHINFFHGPRAKRSMKEMCGFCDEDILCTCLRLLPPLYRGPFDAFLLIKSKNWTQMAWLLTE